MGIASLLADRNSPYATRFLGRALESLAATRSAAKEEDSSGGGGILRAPLPDQGFSKPAAFRDPKVVSRALPITGVDSSSSIDWHLTQIEKLLTLKGEPILTQLLFYSALVDPVEVRAYGQIYMHLLCILHEMGVLSKEHQLWYPVSGADLFPAFFCRQIWTADYLTSSEDMHRWFQEVWSKMREELGAEKQDRLLDIFQHQSQTFHLMANVRDLNMLKRCWIDRTDGRAMKTGDVVLLKNFAGHVLNDNETVEENLSSYLKELTAKVTWVVVIEGDESRCGSVASYFRKRVAEGTFEDFLLTLGPREKSRLDAINNKMRKKVHYLRPENNEIFIHVGGRLSVFRRVS